MRRTCAALVVAGSAAAAFALFTAAALAGGARSDELLPDLTAVPPYDIRVGGDLDRFVVGFGSTSQNVGVANLKMRGHRDSTATSTMAADQLVELKNGSERIYRSAGVFDYVTEETHRHWHWRDFMRYELRRGSDLKLVAPDAKSGFCVADREPIPGHTGSRDFPDPSWCEQDNPDATRLVVGLSVGWGDPYQALVEGQEIALTGVAPGTYYIVHRVNPKRLLRESDYTNNLSASLVSLSWPNGRKARPRVRELVTCAQTGTNRRDRLVHGIGTSGALCGLRGHDALWLLGERGSTALGGPGNDTFVSRFSGSMLDGGTGSDTADYGHAVVEMVMDLREGRVESERGADRLRGIENLTGGSVDDAVRGNGKPNVLIGAQGSDTLAGRGGNDLVRGGPGDDTLIGGGGRDRLFGGGGNDVVLSRDGVRDTIKCGSGFDTVTADRGDRVSRDCESVQRA